MATREELDCQIIEIRMAAVVDRHLAAMERELRPLINRYNGLYSRIVSPALRRAEAIGAKVDRGNQKR